MSDLNLALIIAAIDQTTAPLCKVAGGFRRHGEGIRRSAGAFTPLAVHTELSGFLHHTGLLQRVLDPGGAA